MRTQAGHAGSVKEPAPESKKVKKSCFVNKYLHKYKIITLIVCAPGDLTCPDSSVGRAQGS